MSEEGAVIEQTAAYHVVRHGTESAGLIELAAQHGVIQLKGREVVQFLNGMISNDVKTLEDGAWMLAAFPTVQGRLSALVRVLRIGDSFWLVTDTATHERVFNNLHRFTFAGDFQVHDATAEVTSLSIQGTGAAPLVARVLGEKVADVARNHVVIAELNGSSFPVIRATHTAEDGFDLFAPAETGEALRAALMDAGAQVVDANTLELLRVEAGLPRYGVDVDETNVVLESGLDEAISYTKGCYLGQEIIARIHWRGHVARRLTGIIFADISNAAPGDKIKSTEDKEIGRITSTVVSPQPGKRIALALVKYAYLAAGTEVKVVNEASQEMRAHIADLPFVRGSWGGGTL